MKKFSRFYPHNPLKRLDSDERIQGNPRQSNAHKPGSSQRESDEPRKSKRIDRSNVAARCQEGVEPTPSIYKSIEYLTSSPDAPTTPTFVRFWPRRSSRLSFEASGPRPAARCAPGRDWRWLERGSGSADWDDGRLALSIRSAPSPPDQRSVTHVREPVR